MINEILQFDDQLFQLINNQWHNDFLDSIMPFWRNKYVWLPFYVFLIGFILINYRKKGLILLIFAAILITVSDSLSSKCIKNMVKRERPCHRINHETEMRLLVSCGGGYSFTSSHATNHFALATFLYLTLFQIFRWGKMPILIWAFMVAYAQVYVGVHYPMDVIFGSILGILIGWGFAKLYSVIPKIQLNSTE